MLQLELQRRQVVQARVRSGRVVVPAPRLDDDQGFGAIAKPFDAQAFIAEFSFERFVGTLLTRTLGRRPLGGDAPASG